MVTQIREVQFIVRSPDRIDVGVRVPVEAVTPRHPRESVSPVVARAERAEGQLAERVVDVEGHVRLLLERVTLMEDLRPVVAGELQ